MRTHPSLSALLGLPTLLLLGCAAPADAPDPLTSLTGPAHAKGGAGPPMAGSGTGYITSLKITSSRTAGQNVIQEREIKGELEGSLSGEFVERARGVIHKATGTVTFQATLEFTGTVAGCGDGPGTLSASLSGTGAAGTSPVTEAAFRVIANGQNTLAVSGQGRMNQVGPAITYDVEYVCR